MLSEIIRRVVRAKPSFSAEEYSILLSILYEIAKHDSPPATALIYVYAEGVETERPNAIRNSLALNTVLEFMTNCGIALTESHYGGTYDRVVRLSLLDNP